jgi:soluble lytic murein transglycosylase
MPVITIKKKRLILFIIIIVIIIGVVNLKWIGKKIYPIKYREYIIKYSRQYNLDPLLVASIIRVESKFYRYAESHKGARGLMQISVKTGRWAANKIKITGYTDEQLYDPNINILIGCWYLNNLKEQFNNNLSTVLAAYNGGSGNVTKWLADERYSKDGENLDYIPFKETREYVSKVLNSYKIYRFLYNAKTLK